MDTKIKTIVHDFDILASTSGSSIIVLFLKHPEEAKVTEYPLAHLMLVNKILKDSKLASLKRLIGKTVEIPVSPKEEIEWKSMA